MRSPPRRGGADAHALPHGEGPRPFHTTVSFHNLKSQKKEENKEMSVSNPKSIYVVYLFVLSQISNCQSLGRENKHEILKTDRNNLLALVVQ